MNWGGLSVVFGVAAVAWVARPWGLVALLALVGWYWWNSRQG
jgi:hypothetical protein